MSIIKANGAGDPSTGLYNEIATQSLRFSSARSARLEKTPNASNRQVWTWSAWVKRGNRSESRAIWSVTSSAHFAIFFNSDNSLRVWVNGGNGAIYTNRRFNDTTAWYHIALTAKSSGNYFELYVNGIKLVGDGSNPSVDFSYDNRSSYPGGNDTEVNSNAIHYLGAWNNGGLQYFDGHLADVNFLDGITVGDTNGVLDEFIEIKESVCVPKRYTGSYGTNGYRLEFKQTGLNGGTGTSSTVGADTGNTNHYDSSGISGYDSNMPDCPENNMCTLNPLARLNRGSNVTGTYSETNLKLVHGGAGNGCHGYGSMRVNDFLTDGCYFEILCTAVDSSRFYVGIFDPLTASGPTIASYGFANKAMITSSNTNYSTTATDGGHATSPSTTLSVSNNDIVGVAVKGTSIWFHVNGTYSRDGSNNLGNPSSGANAFVTAITDIANKDYFPYVGYSSSFVLNFGQDPTFAGYLDGSSGKAAGTETPDEGAGVFKYAVPTGFKALCTANMPEPVIGPDSSTQADDHFDVLLYTGTGNDNEDISGLNFKPDLVWKKSRTENVRNTWTDSSRGVGKDIFSDLGSGAESNDTNGIKAFNTDGFRLGTSTNHNVLNKTYVAWNWKANGSTTSSDGNGSITSTVQADTTAGFSIVTFSGNNVTNSTIGHGVKVNGDAKAPAMIITKNRDDGTVSSVDQHWRVFHQDLTDTYTEFLSRTLYEVAPSGHSNGYIHDVTSTTYKTTHANVDSNAVNGSGDDMVAYCWAEVDGYSKFGFYSTTASSDGPFVYTGFKPAFLMVKNISGSSNANYWAWTVHDDTRVAFNPRHSPLFANLYRPEGYRGDDSTSSGGADVKMHFYSNGFKDVSGATEHNGVAGGKVIYMAFASVPSKYANAE